MMMMIMMMITITMNMDDDDLYVTFSFLTISTQISQYFYRVHVTLCHDVSLL